MTEEDGARKKGRTLSKKSRKQQIKRLQLKQEMSTSWVNPGDGSV